MLTTPQHLSQFQVPIGIAVIREGWLGWPWVETVEPALLIKNQAAFREQSLARLNRLSGTGDPASAAFRLLVRSYSRQCVRAMHVRRIVRLR